MPLGSSDSEAEKTVVRSITMLLMTLILGITGSACYYNYLNHHKSLKAMELGYVQRQQGNSFIWVKE